MAKTLADLRARVLIKVGLPSDDAMAPNATLDVCINNGMNKMAADYDWPWLITSENITTVIGTEGYALPAGHIRTLFVTDALHGYNLQGRQRQDMVPYSQTGLAPGVSRFYTTFGSSIRFGPFPNAVLTLYHVYVRAEPALTSGTDSPLCPEHYSDVIVCYAASEFCILNKDAAQKAAIDQEISNWIRRMRDVVHQSAGPLRPRCRQDW